MAIHAPSSLAYPNIRPIQTSGLSKHLADPNMECFNAGEAVIAVCRARTSAKA
jgi:hypothetical protein